MNLGDVVRFWARWNPEGDAVIFGDTTVTWAQLHERTSRIANGLAANGVRRSDRVGILSGNCLQYLELAIAGYELGSILVPLNVRLTPPELAYIVDHAGCRAVVADADLADLAARALDHLETAGDRSDARPITRIGMAPGFGIGFDELRAHEAEDPDVDVAADDVAYICYTSGTTGTPKGAMLSHGNVLAMSHNRILADDLTSASRVYLPFPLSFTGGLVSMWAPAYVGGATFVLDPAVDPKRTLEVIESQRITNYSAVPVIWEQLISHPDFGDHDLSSLTVIGSGGAAVPESLLQRLQDAGLPMSQGYGLTEGAGMNCWLNAKDAQRKLGSCGRPMMHTRVRTVDPEAPDLVDVAVGEVGELILRGPEIMLGYWHDPDATSATLVDGWLRTGDLARIDDEGFVFIVDRSKDMLISGGLNVYPAEIEAVLSGLDGVAECAVIGVADERWGETPAALIGPVPGAEIDPGSILAHCAERLADYKLPRYIVVLDEPLPRGMSGKVLKRELRDAYADPSRLGTPLR
ncbi:MAG: class I adenylate-forming enzyme family protein [Acidimicrobiales bacterium]